MSCKENICKFLIVFFDTYDYGNLKLLICNFLLVYLENNMHKQYHGLTELNC